MKFCLRIYGLTVYLEMVILVTPFEMVYGHEAVLSVEVNLAAYILAKQNDLYGIMYHELMMDNVDR